MPRKHPRPTCPDASCASKEDMVRAVSGMSSDRAVYVCLSCTCLWSQVLLIKKPKDLQVRSVHAPGYRKKSIGIIARIGKHSVKDPSTSDDVVMDAACTECVEEDSETEANEEEYARRCIICYENDNLHSLACCNVDVHPECLSKWVRVGANRNCINCRMPLPRVSGARLLSGVAKRNVAVRA